MATLSSILAWEIRGACQGTILGVAEELEITETLNNITVSQENQTKHNLLLFHRDEDQVSKIC